MYPHASISKKSLTLSQILFSRKITSKRSRKSPGVLARINLFRTFANAITEAIIKYKS